MRLPRFQIGWLMAVVAIVALNALLVRELSDPRTYSEFIEMSVVGALPMANILAIGGFLLWKRSPSRTFLVGFELVGSLVLMTYLLLAWLSPDLIRNPLRRVFNPIYQDMGSPEAYLPFFLAVVASCLLLPQVLLGLVGGFLMRKFRLAGRPA